MTEIATQLESLQGQSDVVPIKQDALDEVFKGIAKLRKELTDVTGILPTYDQRQCELVSMMFFVKKNAVTSC